jgi:SulP family sulfate permease
LSLVAVAPLALPLARRVSIVMCLAGGISAAADLDVWGVPLVRDLGEVVAHVPPFVGFPFNLESLKLIPRITSVAIAVALLGMLEAVAIAKSLAVRSGQHIDPNQELIGMGIGQPDFLVFLAPCPAPPPSCAAATNLQSGGLTQFATIMGCGFILLIIC